LLPAGCIFEQEVAMQGSIPSRKGPPLSRLTTSVVAPSGKVFTAIVEKCHDTDLYVGYVPNMPGAHSQGETLDELYHNLQEVIEMLLEDGELLQNR
jgi:predicted RNase H-like HicB family nuclease